MPSKMPCKPKDDELHLVGMETEEKKINEDTIDLLFFKISIKSLGLLIVLGFIGWLILRWFFSVPIPGHWNESSSYKTNLYVNLFQDKDNSKNYRVVGEVVRENFCDNDSEGNSYCFGVYRLLKATFPHTGELEFDDCELFLNKKQWCRDDTNGDEWAVELTDQPAD